jgi:hypothetical protein
MDHLSHYLRDTLYTYVFLTLACKSQVSGYLKGCYWPKVPIRDTAG